MVAHESYLHQHNIVNMPTVDFLPTPSIDSEHKILKFNNSLISNTFSKINE